MATKLFVGSLSYQATDDDLQAAFAAVGQVVSAKVIMDRDTGRSKGFGFVEMSTEEEAQKAVKEVNGKEIAGRPVVVNEARPQEPRGERRSFGGNDRRDNSY
jgi:cold-inducible RNA-binding protein